LLVGSAIVYYNVVDHDGLPFLYKLILPAVFISVLFVARVLKISEIKVVLKSFKRSK